MINILVKSQSEIKLCNSSSLFPSIPVPVKFHRNCCGFFNFASYPWAALRLQNLLIVSGSRFKHWLCTQWKALGTKEPVLKYWSCHRPNANRAAVRPGAVADPLWAPLSLSVKENALRICLTEILCLQNAMIRYKFGATTQMKDATCSRKPLLSLSRHCFPDPSYSVCLWPSTWELVGCAESQSHPLGPPESEAAWE